MNNFSFKSDIKNNVNSNAKVALTTINNVFSPFEQYVDWLNFDMQFSRENDIPTCQSLQARFAKVSDEMSEEQYDLELERAIDEIVKSDMTNTYVKAVNKNFKGYDE